MPCNLLGQVFLVTCCVSLPHSYPTVQQWCCGENPAEQEREVGGLRCVWDPGVRGAEVCGGGVDDVTGWRVRMEGRVGG